MITDTARAVDADLAAIDPELQALLDRELERQRGTLDMIASENVAPAAVLQCQGSVLTNKYAEGYPGRRYYGGCEVIDEVESLAIERARGLFGGEHVNVQPHSGAQANAAVYHGLLEPGDTILGLELAHGGHLTHGMRLNLSGRLYEIASYHVRREDGLIDMEEVERLAREHAPKLVLAGWSAYPRQIDLAAFQQIAWDAGAIFMVDMAHFAGLVAARLHPDPVRYADVVTTTVHKTLGGARGGMIICREEHAKAIDSAVFPGQQGGPLEHVVAAKAASLKLAGEPEFRERMERTVSGARLIAAELVEGAPDVGVLTGGTDVHLVLVDLRESELDGVEAEQRLSEIGITANRNAIPFDPRPPMVSSGLRLGTAALATRGFGDGEFRRLGEIVADALKPDFDSRRGELRSRCAALAAEFPLYPGLATEGETTR